MPKYVIQPSTVESATSGPLEELGDRLRKKMRGQIPDPNGYRTEAIASNGRKGGANRKGARSALWRAVKQVNASSIKDLLEAFSDEDFMDNLYESLDKERVIDISAVEISDADKIVTYSIRHETRKKEVGFKRLREIFEETNRFRA
ncbi:MAG: hypothetical protein ACREYF_11515 [Gammaproteobacteria bacterium]